MQNNAETMADVVAEQTVTNDSSLLGELRQDRQIAEPEEELDELAPMGERIFTRIVRPPAPAVLREAKCRQRPASAPPRRSGTTGTGPDAEPRPMDQGVASNMRGTARKCFLCGKLHAYFGDCTVKFARLYTFVR